MAVISQNHLIGGYENTNLHRKCPVRLRVYGPQPSTFCNMLKYGAEPYIKKQNIKEIGLK